MRGYAKNRKCFQEREREHDKNILHILKRFFDI